MKNLAKPITPIRDEAAHRAALAEIERMWGRESNTPEGDRLDVLMALVDDYERMNWPDEALDPIDAISGANGDLRTNAKGLREDRRLLRESFGNPHPQTTPYISDDLAARGGVENACGASCAALQARSAGNQQQA